MVVIATQKNGSLKLRITDPEELKLYKEHPSLKGKYRLEEQTAPTPPEAEPKAKQVKAAPKRQSSKAKK